MSVYVDPAPPRKTNPSTIEVESLPRADEMAAWLKSLPKPVGLMAATDNRAHQVLNICGQYGIAVPDEVAVIGVDNDEILCELCDPPLSSVALNPWKVGYEAAALLDRMIGGAAPPRQRILIPPLGVVVRRSTDVVTIPDADLAVALRLIRKRVRWHRDRRYRAGIADFAQHVEAAVRGVPAAIAQGRDSPCADGAGHELAEHDQASAAKNRRAGRFSPRGIDVQAI